MGSPRDFIFQPWQLYLVILAGWINRQQQEVIEYLRTENQVLKETHGNERILLNDDQRRRLAVTVGHGVPRVAKLLALAIRFDQLVSDGVVANYAELARLGRVTRARVTQIMNLLNLAPDIQEQILFSVAAESERESITERELRPIATVTDWRKQRRMWRSL